MIEKDTVRLLRECDAGVKMGIDSIDEVVDSVKARPMREALLACRGEHQRLGGEIRAELRRFQDEGKEPGAVAKAMSRMKTETNLLLRESDATIADLMTDGCNMGVKSLSRYLNQYQAADERSKDIARRLIRQEQDLAFQMRSFL